MKHKVYSAIIVIIAVVIGILAIGLPPEKLDGVSKVYRFFDAMLPILGVGALIKYLCCCHNHHHCHDEHHHKM